MLLVIPFRRVILILDMVDGQHIRRGVVSAVRRENAKQVQADLSFADGDSFAISNVQFFRDTTNVCTEG